MESLIMFAAAFSAAFGAENVEMKKKPCPCPNAPALATVYWSPDKLDDGRVRRDSSGNRIDTLCDC